MTKTHFPQYSLTIKKEVKGEKKVTHAKLIRDFQAWKAA